MPKLKPETQLARREHILDMAEQCFARHGFHASSMQMICAEAGISAGALYVYFDSKEALIAGICERDRAEFSERFAGIAGAPDVMAALGQLAAHYFVHEQRNKLAMMVEIGAESMRSEAVREMFAACETTVRGSFTSLIERLTAEGRITPRMPVATAVALIQVIGDGLLWRRATDPGFEGETVVRAAMQLIGEIIGLDAGDGVQPASQDGEVNRI